MRDDIPQGWRLAKISDLVTLEYGKSPKNILSKNGQYPVYGTGGLTGYASSYLYEGKTTVIGRKGTINKPYFVEGKFWAIDTTFFGTGYDAVHPKWFYYNLHSFDLAKYNEASGVPSLGRETLYSIPLLTPPAVEQEKIAAILSSADGVINKIQVQVNKLNLLKTGMMQELFRGEVEDLAVSPKDLKGSQTGKIPGSWNACMLKDCLSFISYGFTNPMPESREGPFMITAKDVNGLKIDYNFARKTTEEAYRGLLSDKSRPKPNDILLTKDGTLGRVALVDRADICINQSVAVLRPNKKVIPKFLLYLLASPLYQRAMLDNSGGSTIKHIYITVVDQMPIAIPDIEEQINIVKILEALSRSVSLAEEKLHRYTSIKKALMQDLLTGKVRVKIDEKEKEPVVA